MEEMNNFNGVNYTTEGSYTVPGYDGMVPEPMKKESRGLEIATLVFGVLAILICCCNGFFGLIGLVLGIIALVKGKRSGMTIAGFVCSILGVLGAIIILIVSMTDYGQELQDAFWDGFERGYESASGEDIDIFGDADYNSSTEEDVSNDSPVQKHEGTVSVSDEIAGKVVVDGKTIQIPCKLSDVLEIYEASEDSEGEMQGGLTSFESKYIYLSDNGAENGVFIGVENRTERDMKDVKDGMICTMSIDNEPEKNAELLGGIKLGMSESNLEDFLSDMQYNKSETDGVLFYDLYAGDDDDYYVTIMVSEGKVITVTLYYLNY